MDKNSIRKERKNRSPFDDIESKPRIFLFITFIFAVQFVKMSAARDY